MNAAIITVGSNYTDPIGNRIIHSPCIVIVDSKTFQYDVLRNPLANKNSMQNTIDFILLLIKRNVSKVFVRHCIRDLRMLLGNHGISVMHSVSWTLGEMVIRLKGISLENTEVILVPTESDGSADYTLPVTIG